MAHTSKGGSVYWLRVVSAGFVSRLVAGESVKYEVAGESFGGYIANGGPDALMVLLVHDWDGLTDYEVKRADMLVGMGYSVFCADLFGVGI